MPDEDELENDVEDVLLVEALMGWDGDRCECVECDCPRFMDAADDRRCGDCRDGRHWTESAGKAG